MKFDLFPYFISDKIWKQLNIQFLISNSPHALPKGKSMGRQSFINKNEILHMIINTMSTAVAPFVIKGNVIVSLVMIIWQFAAILIGAVFLVLKFKHINLKKTEPIVKPEDYLVNTGVICYLSICMVMIIIITVFY